jgi:hypothetical protein
MGGRESGRLKRKSSAETMREHHPSESIAKFFAPANRIRHERDDKTTSRTEKSGIVRSNADADSGKDATVQEHEEIILLDSPPRDDIDGIESIVICEEDDQKLQAQDHSQTGHSSITISHLSQHLGISIPHAVESSGSGSGCNNDMFANSRAPPPKIRSSSFTAGNFGALVTAKGDCTALSWWVRSFSSAGYRNKLPQARRTPGIGIYRMAWGKRVTLGLASFSTNMFGGGRTDAEAVAVPTPTAGSAPNAQQAHCNSLTLISDQVANKSILGMELSADDREVLCKLQTANVRAQKLLLSLKHACHPMCGDTNYAACRYAQSAYFLAKDGVFGIVCKAVCIDKVHNCVQSTVHMTRQNTCACADIHTVHVCIRNRKSHI